MSGLRRIFPFLRPYRLVIIGGILTVILPVAMELVVPRMLQTVIDQGIVPGDFGAIWWGALVMLGAAVVGALTTVLQGVCRAQLSQGLAFDMRNALFTHVQSFSFADLDRMQTGQIMTRLSSDVDVVRMFASAGVALLLRALLMIIGSVIMMAVTDLRLTLVAVGMLFLATLVMRTVLSRTTPLFATVQQKLGALNTLVQENLAGVQVVKAFAREPHAVAQYETRNIDYMQQNIRVGYLLVTVLPSLTVITNLGLVAVIWWGGSDVIGSGVTGGRLSVGQLVAFINYLMIGMAPLLLLSNILTMISRAEVSAVRVAEVLDTQPSVRVAATPHRGSPLGALQGDVVFDRVSFFYGNGNGNGSANGSVNPNGNHRNGSTPAVKQPAPAHAVNGRNRHIPSSDTPNLRENSFLLTPDAGASNSEKAVLNEISFAARAGRRIALLGATGAGKSTLVHLIPRFYDVTGGRILIDGVDVREWDLPTLRSRVGVVLQQNTLFSGTIHENIAYGRPDALLSDVQDAAHIAQAHDFIAALPDGYNSIVEARGANLSGGQKQRIAIARALLMQPSILILDDCTSAVDMDTEFKILEALDTVMQRCTTFLVAQRINSVLDADNILILDAGDIVAQGTHRELYAGSPIYQQIYRSQLDVEEMTDLLKKQGG